MSPFKDSNPRQHGNKAEAYPSPDTMDVDAWLSTIPSPPSSPRTMPQSTQHSKLFRRRYFLCFILLSGVFIYTAISVISTADIVELLAWKHRDDFILSLHFKFSQLFLQSYFKVAQWKASTNNMREVGYGGNIDMGWVIHLCIVPCVVICGLGRLFDYLSRS
ncbi:hypothetical protein F52700_935 [Fusarium sp. NRRL 52700]|nr:hypothetical protein F52700_935 [Fusarium sp. NRRL 52700]